MRTFFVARILSQTWNSPGKEAELTDHGLQDVLLLFFSFLTSASCRLVLLGAHFSVFVVESNVEMFFVGVIES